MKHVRHIFFDLDHTLWDFETNSRETLRDLLVNFEEAMGKSVDFEEFYSAYTVVNEKLWKDFRESKISSQFLREVRFRRAFSEFGVKEGEWIDQFGDDYMDVCPKKSNLIPFALEILHFLRPNYRLHMVTNGFTHTQAVKLRHSGLESFFEHVITSETAQAKKPDPAIFHYAFQLSQSRPDESLYIGDNYEADVIGGRNAGMDVVYFNPEKRENPLKVPEITCLSELKELLV